jgi:hypothetical protein
MKIKPLIIFDIICFNLVIIVWGLLSVNSYRELIVNNLVVPQNPVINNLFFSSLLSCYLSSNSLLAFTYEFGKNDSNFYFHIINSVFIIFTMGFNFSEYQKCDETCIEILDNSFYNFIDYYQYLPIFQIVILINYVFFFIKTNKKDLLINEDFNDVFIQSPITTGVLRLDQDSNSNSSDEIGL